MPQPFRITSNSMNVGEEITTEAAFQADGVTERAVQDIKDVLKSRE